MRDHSAIPVSTLEQAVWWLVCHSPDCSDFIHANMSTDHMPIEALLVCDIHWLTRENLRRKLVSAFRELDHAASPASARSRYRGA